MVCDGFTEKRPKANSTPLSTRIGKHCVRFGCLFTVLVVKKCKLLKTGFKVQVFGNDTIVRLNVNYKKADL